MKLMIEVSPRQLQELQRVAAEAGSDIRQMAELGVAEFVRRCRQIHEEEARQVRQEAA